MGGSAPSLAAATPWLIPTIRRSIWTKRPESARFDHSALAVVCTSTTQPSPRFSAVTSGVTYFGPGTTYGTPPVSDPAVTSPVTVA